MKYGFFDIKESWEKKMINKALKKEDVVFFDGTVQDADPKDLKQLDVVSVFVGSLLDSENLKKMPKLKLVATRSTGFDHIDVKYCKNNKIAVSYVPFYGENTVAEFAFALMIAISRNVIDSVHRVKTGSFSFAGLRGFDLKDKTVGIMGFGHIGQKFAKMCKGFDMKVLAYDPFSEKLQPVADEIGVKFCTIEDIMKKSNIISLHMPLNKETKHILNKNTLEMAKQGLIIINTARGGLIETRALINALDSGKVVFAAIDVLEGENDLKDELHFLERNYKDLNAYQTLIENHELMRRHNVYITPHNAFNTKEALERIMQTTLLNIVAFSQKKELLNPVKL